MRRIKDIIFEEAERQDNGRWIFEGKDAHSWFGEALRYEKAHQNEMNLERLGILDEMFLISATLQRMDLYGLS